MKQWICHIEGKQYGPVDEAELRQWIAQGRVKPTDLIWSEGMTEWVPASTLGASGSQTPPTTPPPVTPPGVSPGMSSGMSSNMYAESSPGLYRSYEPHRGVMILIFGILGLVCCIIFAILAWVMGNGDIRKMDMGEMDPSGRGLTQAGRIMGIIGCILNILWFIIGLLGGGAGSL